jgi:transposase
MTSFSLHSKQRAALERLLTHSRDSRQIIRAYALLWLDEGVTAEEIAEALGTSRQSIYNWATRFEQRQGLALELRLADGARSGRPPTAKGIIEPLIEAAIDLDPRSLGYHATVWTAPLLAFHLRQKYELRVSAHSVRRAIARLGLRWKRPRHRMALRPKT